MATKKKTATSSNKKPATVKKVAAKKVAPAKKVAAKKVAPAKKVVAKKAAPPKKVVAKKAAPAKKVVAKKVAPAKKVVAKKAAPAKKVVAKKAAPTKKVVAKKATPVKTNKAISVEQKLPAKKVANQKIIEKAPKKVIEKKAAPLKKATKAIAKKSSIPAVNSTRSEIKDAFRTKPSNLSSDTIIAHRVLEKKSKKQDNDKDTTMKEYNSPIRSILAPTEQHTGPSYRYSDDELNEFKELILKRLESARENLVYYQALITRKDEAGTEDTDNRFNSLEDGSGAMEREQLSQLAARQIQFINHLEKALMRIENKTYGICRVTGKLIDKARLRAVPHATLSIEAKNQMK